jgi:hypothetical protein
MTEEEINLNGNYVLRLTDDILKVITVVQKRRIDGPWHVEAKGIGWFNVDKIVRKV